MLIVKAQQRIQQYITFLKQNRYRELSQLNFEYFETTETYRNPPTGVKWEKITTPFEYGKPWRCSWFRAFFKTPAQNKYPLYLRVVPNADSLVFIDGKPAGAFNPIHKKIKVNADGNEHEFYMESYAGHHYPGCHPFHGGSVILTVGKHINDYPNIFLGGALTERIEPVYALYYDVLCLFELAKTLDENSLRKAKIIKGLYDALMDIHFSSGSGTVLEEEAADARTKIMPLLEAKNGSTAVQVFLTGHAHIDHAWLWHIGETERKTARTFINMIKLMEEYPEFIFVQSQGAQLEIVKKNYQEIFEAVKDAYKKGRWEPNGCMWVEADCNLPGGESLIRQFLVGKRAVKEMLDYEGDTLWLPDVFGYSAAMPQILSGCRIKYFVTSKINWNDTTRFPYDTFIWKGIDGTGIKTHYITNSYNGQVNPADMQESWYKIQHKEIQFSLVKPIGEGDGGGGTARGDLEMARRLANLEGAPKASWKKVSEALEIIFGETEKWPEWKGELYLELHRGTYTTQSAVKRYNRKLEFALRNAEFLSAIAMLENDTPYPHERFLSNWKPLLTNQFHDIIPGSSIGRVYDEAKETYRTIENDLSDLYRSIMKIFTGFPPESGSKEKESEYCIRVFNDLSWERNDPVNVPAGLLQGVSALKIQESGEETENDLIYPVQFCTDPDGSETAMFCPSVPSLGWITLYPAEKNASSSFFSFRGNSLKTPFYEVKFDEEGRIISLFDLNRDRELTAPGGVLNGFISAQDVPILWEAWDIESDWKYHITEETRLMSTEISASGPVCFKIRRKYRIGESSVLVQDTAFYTSTARIDFETLVDWQERRRLLKVQFDTNISTAQIRCEIQYGHLLRNTHQNLPQDRARFEFCAHKWVSLEEEGGGIALLNDCKYGHDAEGGTVRLTLLRSPAAPDPNADRGEHRFTYSLFPFTGSFGQSEVIRRSYELNSPAKAEGAFTNALNYSLFWIEGGSVIAETIKAVEPYIEDCGKKLLIRLYESLGGPASVILHFNKPIIYAAETDMLEENPKELSKAGEDLFLEFRAFEIKTIMIAF
ncbi:MAG: glycosyl hydrolase-related protein [Treponema sp.]|nr:glycosyl hydrolase-related protein [Treponema sp.]MCL2244387.1 glycosyl hydrolase-related protein [Treponema sp.]